MAKSKKELHDDLLKELDRLHKERQALEKHKPHSDRHHQAKLRLLRLRGMIAATEKALAEAVARADKQGKGAAVRYAAAHVGVSEHPSGSNSGPQIDIWAKAMGFPGSGVFWCGIFAGYCIAFVGNAKIPVPSRMAAGTYIIDDARAGRNGLHAKPFGEIEKGDLLSYWNGEHIGLAAGRPVGGVVHTFEGNTSPSSAGSQYNGGCVAPKVRSAADVTVAARPAWR